MRSAHLPLLLLIGCGGADFDAFGAAVKPGEGCDFDPNAALDGVLEYDVAASSTFQIPIVYENTTSGPLTPISFDLRWECFNGGFTNHGPLFLPTYGPTSFCLDRRNDAEQFAGFDIVDASGTRTEPGERGIAYVEVVPTRLGMAMDRNFQVAVAAKACVDVLASDPNAFNADECTAAQTMFDADLYGYSVQDISQLDAIAAFAAYDGSEPNSGAFGMDVRGVLIAADDSSGRKLSGEVFQSVRICRNCGEEDVNGVRGPLDMSCY